VEWLCKYGDKGRAGEADDKTLYYCTSDSLLASHLNISLPKSFATTVSGYGLDGQNLNPTMV
jgi:hypothetical protein